jgi:hypothetical protein
MDLRTTPERIDGTLIHRMIDGPHSTGGSEGHASAGPLVQYLVPAVYHTGRRLQGRHGGAGRPRKPNVVVVTERHQLAAGNGQPGVSCQCRPKRLLMTDHNDAQILGREFVEDLRSRQGRSVTDNDQTRWKDSPESRQTELPRAAVQACRASPVSR